MRSQSLPPRRRKRELLRDEQCTAASGGYWVYHGAAVPPVQEADVTFCYLVFYWTIDVLVGGRRWGKQCEAFTIGEYA